ncbi:MAG: hypothetical protein ABIH86_00215 [Planctomycetota bacterium]
MPQESTPERHKIIIPGDDSPKSLKKLLDQFARRQRTVTLITRRGERFVLKLTEIRDELAVGEVRVLNWSPDVTRRIYDSGEHRLEGEGFRAMLLADAIDKYGKDAHRYKVYISLDDIIACYEDMDDAFDETPFQPLP